jgi:FkbM family methyltransferase
MFIEQYGFKWELNEDKGQLGLLREDHYRPLFTTAQREKSLRPDDIWLDIGANIGAFAIRAAEHVRLVVAVEPEADNLWCLRKNLHLNGSSNVMVEASAITGGHEKILSLALSNTFSSTHRIGHIRGRREVLVPAVNIDTIIRGTTANKIKMDCEGSEAEIIENMDLSPIEEMIFEYHFSFLHDDNWSRFRKIMDRLVSAGFQVKKQPAKQSKTWHTIVWVKRL